MSEESRAHRWVRLVEEEQEAFERARASAGSAGPAQRTNLSREWLAATATLLKEYRHLHACPHEVSLPHPSDCINRVADLLDALAAGRLPQPVTDATAAGGGLTDGLASGATLQRRFITSRYRRQGR